MIVKSKLATAPLIEPALKTTLPPSLSFTLSVSIVILPLVITVLPAKVSELTSLCTLPLGLIVDAGPSGYRSCVVPPPS